MFARKVSVRLKPGRLHEFAKLMQSEILGWLRQQEGFLDLITLAAPDGREVATITFWDHEINAQSWSAGGYPEALKTLEALLDGVPYVKTFEVIGSTLPRLSHFTATPRPENATYLRT
jgi:heme-degrading monooxygenase HmoA